MGLPGCLYCVFSLIQTNGGFKKDKKKPGDNGQRASEGENGPHHQQDRPSLLLENLNTGKLGKNSNSKSPIFRWFSVLT